jgi:predicted metal-dependent phosphoesterase TrpH
MLKLKLDLHIHSVYSLDALNTVETIARRLNTLGFDGYALADHDTISGFQEAKTNSYNLSFIPALEVSANNAHILALDPVEAVKPHLSMQETVDLIHDQGALAILAHPYAFPKSWANYEHVKDAHFDAIEVANSAQFPYGFIFRLNMILATRLNLPITGGSDSHIPETIGRSYTIVESESNEAEDIIKAIKLGRSSVGGTSTNICEWFSKKIRKKNWKYSQSQSSIS